MLAKVDIINFKIYLVRFITPRTIPQDIARFNDSPLPLEGMEIISSVVEIILSLNPFASEPNRIIDLAGKLNS